MLKATVVRFGVVLALGVVATATADASVGSEVADTCFAGCIAETCSVEMIQNECAALCPGSNGGLCGDHPSCINSTMIICTGEPE